MPKRHTQIFVSYSRSDIKWVEGLIDTLESIGNNYKVWFDSDIPGGSSWWEEILNQIEDCSFFIHVGSIKAYESLYCQKELKYAFDLNKPMIPIILHPDQRPGADAEDEKQAESGRLDKISEIAMHIFEDYADYDHFNSKQRIPLYEKDDEVKMRSDMESALCTARVDLAQGKYPKVEGVNRPERPSGDARDLFDKAKFEYTKNNFEIAKKLFGEAIRVGALHEDQKQLAEEYISEIERRQRKQLADNQVIYDFDDDELDE